MKHDKAKRYKMRYACTALQLKQEDSVALFDLSGNVHTELFKFFIILCVSMNNYKSATNVDFEVSNKF